jgi:hypothetical protein
MDSNDPLWQLLGKAPLREPDAWFAARTVARLRRQARPTIWAAWRRIVTVSAWAGAATAVTLMLTVHFAGLTLHQNHDTAKIQDALDYIADRGTESDVWLSSSTL